MKCKHLYDDGTIAPEKCCLKHPLCPEILCYLCVDRHHNIEDSTMPTPSHEEPLKPESVEEITTKVLTTEALLKAFDDTSYARGYAAGRASMKAEILTVFQNAKTGWYDAGEGLDIEYSAKEMRSELLDDIEGVE